MTDLFCRGKANDEFKPHRLLDRNVSRFRSLKNLVYVVGGLAEQIIEVRSVGHEAALINKFLLEVNSRQPVFRGKLDDPLSFGEKGAIGGRYNRLDLLLLRGLKGAFQTFGVGFSLYLFQF